ncbi:hypothetical protein C8J57DRAFT_1470787 [Mycena rebaudengoi]|nr:hypothetical protein C8J57DRAFT_1470787 [Mycena rebaudengoi]
MDSVVSSNINTTLGAYQIGVLISYALLGVTTSQTYIYYTRFPEDSLKLKALVVFVWICEVAHALCIGHTLYQYTISDYGHQERLSGPLPHSPPQSCSFPASSPHARLLHRSITGGFAGKLRGALGLALPTMWSIGAVNDLLTTATLVVYLYGQRTRAQRRTVLLVDKIIVWSIETGMITTASAIATLACFISMPKNMIWLAVFIIASRLYSNSLLASLNSRETLRAMNGLEVSLHSLTPATGLPSSSMQITKDSQIRYDTEPSQRQCDKVSDGV